ncbi:MAG: tetratricopeptide repeat protein [bacterium]|nr:tetratricopeptide repeat protein [bacterium]
MSNRSHSIVAFTLIALVAVVYLVMALHFPMAYIWGTYEDVYGEWAQTFLFLAAMVFSLRIAVLESRYRTFFLFLALACFYVVGEEISWGQRIFGWGSPELFKEKNLQGETNLHNFMTGPYSTQLKGALEYLIVAGLVIYGVVYPLASRLGARAALWLERRGLPAPPLCLWPAFLIAAYLELGVLSFNEAEVAEILIGFAMTATAVHYSFVIPRGLDPHAPGAWEAGDSGRLAFRFLAVAAAVVFAAVVTTQAIYSSAEGKRKIDNRIANGVEKFAGRYERYERWAVAARLHGKVLERRPQSLSTHLDLVQSYRELGDEKRAEEYLEKALAIGLERYRQDATRASVNRSLVRTYRLIGDETRADYHLRRALGIGLSRIEDHPTSDNAAYSLGRTYELMGEERKAYEQFASAYALEPSKRNRKAYFRARSRGWGGDDS